MLALIKRTAKRALMTSAIWTSLLLTTAGCLVWGIPNGMHFVNGFTYASEKSCWTLPEAANYSVVMMVNAVWVVGAVVGIYFLWSYMWRLIKKRHLFRAYRLQAM